MKESSNKKRLKPSAEKGYDFGTPAYFFDVPNTDWLNVIKKAEVLGCAYGVMPVTGLGLIPSISLIARNAERLESAFATFKSWTEGSDDDAVDATIVFLNSGGYLFGISPEPFRRSAKVPVPAILDPLQMMATWVKPMDTTSAEIRRLAEYHKGFLAPIALCAATISSDGPLQAGAPTNVRALLHVPPLVKFSYLFVKEENENLPAAAQVILDLHRKEDSNGRPKAARPPQHNAKQWGHKRTSVLREQCGLTVFRGRQSGLFFQLRQRYSVAKVADWQIDQAICNVEISRRKLRRDHYVGTGAKELQGTIIEAINDSVPLADSKGNMPDVAVETVEKQIWLDADYLVHALNEIPRDRSLASRQKILQRRGYLALS